MAARFLAIAIAFVIPSIAAPPSVIPGTGVETDAYDPKHGGWDSEQLAEQAGAILKAFGKALSVSEDVKYQGLLASIDTKFNGPSFRQANLTLSYDDGTITVGRVLEPSRVKAEHVGTPGFTEAVESFRALLDEEKALHAKFKVVGVTLESNVALTPVEVRLDGTLKSGQSFQINAQWECQWGRDGDGRLRWRRVTITDYEEILTKTERNTSLFTDATSGVLGNDPAFKAHLAYGLDHWLARMDSRLRLLVGGWNGLAIGDANGDGLDDLYLCQGGGLPNRLFLTQKDGTARDVASSAGVNWLEPSRGALFLDLDNDGDQDLVVGVAEGLLLHENDGTGNFTVRGAKVLPEAIPYTMAAADFDEDGRLDLYAACYDRRGHVDRNASLARPVPYHDANNGGRNVLLRNLGAFKFGHVTKRHGLDENNTRYSYAATWADYDGDGDLDLYVANDFGRNNLYRQDRSGGQITFVDVAEKAGVLDIAAGMSAVWGDYDNDGRLDLYVSNMFSSAGNRIAKQARFLAGADAETKDLFVRHARGNSLFRNLGNGAFEDVSVSAGVTQGRWAWGSLLRDFNNDGWEDVVVANGFITQEDTGDL